MSQAEFAVTARGEFWRGARMSAPFMPGTAAWALVVGVTMIKSGLTVPLAVGMSFLVYVGTAQVAALPLIGAGAPVWMVLLTTLIFNLRFLIYSAALSPLVRNFPLRWRLGIGYLLTDNSFVLISLDINKGEERPHRKWLMLGPTLCNWTVWQSMTLLGIVLGSQIPSDWGLNFAGTLALAALAFMSMSNRFATTGALVAGLVALACAGLPLKIGLIIGVIAGMIAALSLESWVEKRS